MYQRPQGRKPSGPTIIAAVLIAVLAVVTIVAALTAFQPPEPVTEQAKDIDLLYQPVLAISFLVFFGIAAALIWAIFRYRRTGPEIPEQVHGNDKLEFAWTVIPIVILAVLFIPAFILVIDLKTPPDADDVDLTVEAIGSQFFWSFNYPDDGVRVLPEAFDRDSIRRSPPALVVPVGQTIRVIVRSVDVIHSFYAPNTLYKIQAVPGNINEMHFKVTKAGTFSGQCYQFCGERHSDMLFVIDARAPAEFEAWLREMQRAQGVSPSRDAVATGSGD